MLRSDNSLTLTTFALVCMTLMACGNDLNDQDGSAEIVTSQKERPNFLIIVADDMGYSDLGAFGGEIETPNLDKLANTGLRLTKFYVSPMCSTTRAMLLTGADHHYVGLGNMTPFLTDDQRGKPGYEGYLNDRIPTLATRLKSVGYHTSISGKWHVGSGEEQSPSMKGFERSFVLEGAGGNHFNANDFRPDRGPAVYRRDGESVTPPEAFYSSKLFTDDAIKFIDEAIDEKRSFLSILAFTAPHAPIQAPMDFIEKYRGRYDLGFGEVARKRLNRMHGAGILTTPNHDIASTLERHWQSLSKEEREYESRKMEVYAAMVDFLDSQVGRAIEHLSKRGVLDNTVVIFFSDNGANGLNRALLPNWVEWMQRASLSNDLDNLGTSTSNAFVGERWAQMSNAPFRLYKTMTSEGGIRTPAIFWYPRLRNQASMSHSVVTVKDIYPTILEMVGAKNISLADGANPSQGQSMLAFLRSETDSVHDSDQPLGFELNGKSGLIQGDWKILRLPEPHGTDAWTLHHLGDDISESQDLFESEPEIANKLLDSWKEYVELNGVVDPGP